MQTTTCCCEQVDVSGGRALLISSYQGRRYFLAKADQPCTKDGEGAHTSAASHATHQAEDEEACHVLEAGFSPHAHALADARRKSQEADASRVRVCCTLGLISSLSFPNSSHSNYSTLLLLLAMDFPTKFRKQMT